MSPISFSDKFALLTLKGSQNLIGKSSLSVVVDNIKPFDLLSALYVPCFKSRSVPRVLFISLMLQNDYSSQAKFLFSDENLRIPDLLTLLKLSGHDTIYLMPFSFVTTELEENPYCLVVHPNCCSSS